MFKPDKMYKVTLFFQKERLEEVMNELYRHKLIEFFEIEEEGFERFDHEDLNELSHSLLRMRSTINILNLFHKKDLNDYEEDSIEKTLELKRKLDTEEKELIYLCDELKRVTILKELEVSRKELNSPNTIIGFLPLVKKPILNILIGKGIEYRTFTLETRTYFIAKSKKLPFAFKEFYLPKYDIEIDLNTKIMKNEKRIENIKSSLKEIADNSLETLKLKENGLAKKISIMEAKPKFLETKNFVVINGYVAKNSYNKLERVVKEILEDKVEISYTIAKEDAPIQLSNYPIIRKFEELLQMYSLPKYREFDPTILIFLMFPLFFGFILGDVFYGLIALIFFTILRIKKPNLKDLLTILQWSAVSSIFFGIIYGEFMGFEFHGSFYGFFERSSNPETLLITAVIFGLIHINLGLLIGFINALPNWKKAIYDKASYILLQVSALFLALGYIGNTLNFIISGWGLMALSLALIYLGHSFIGIMEVPSFFTNILSYARLMAVGLSSIVIAILINNYTLTLFSQGVIGIIFGIILFSVGHIFNIALGCFEGFLHTLRLHYVEFFTKFYSGGGREFKPFGQIKELN